MTNAGNQSLTVNGSSTIIKDRWIDLARMIAPRLPDQRFAVLPALSGLGPSACLDEADRTSSRSIVTAARVMMGGGAVEAGEDPLVAQRELLEETGTRGRAWQACGNFSPNPATHQPLPVFSRAASTCRRHGSTPRRISTPVPAARRVSGRSTPASSASCHVGAL